MLVTDDEIVAASTLRDRRWQGALPSIELDDPASLVDAASRGIRSLRVRELLDAGESISALAGELIDAVDGTIRALVYVADEARPLLPAGPSIGVIQSNGSWLLDVTAPEGVHDLTSITGSVGAWRAIETLLSTAGDLAEDRVLSVIAVRPDGQEGIFISINGDEAITTPLSIPLAEDLESVHATTSAEAIRAVREVFGE